MGGFIDDVVSFIGKPFGIYTHDETFTDIQISNLLTPGEADKNARKNAKYYAKGNAQVYQQGYRQFQKDYRKKYSAKFMESQGYAPSSTATATTLTEDKAEVYIEGLYGYDDVNIESAEDRYLTVTEKGLHAVQQIVGYEYATGRIIVGGKTYNAHQYVELPDDTQLEVTSTRLYDETIEQDLTDNHNYDGTYIYENTGPTTLSLSGTASSTATQVKVEIRDSLLTLVETKIIDVSITKEWTFDSQTHGNDTYEITVLESGLLDPYVDEVQNYTEEVVSATKDYIDVTGTATTYADSVDIVIKDSLNVTVDSTTINTSVTKDFAYTSITLTDDTYTIIVSENIVDEPYTDMQTAQYSDTIDDVEAYIVGAFSSVVYDNAGTPSYKTETTKVLDGVTVLDVYTPVERIVNVVTEPAYGTEASYIKYRVTSGEVGTELRYWVGIAGSVSSLYDNVTIDITTIIPMKENNSMVDLEGRKLNRMLRKLNLSGEQFQSSIENPDMDSAYLMTGVDPQRTDDVTTEVMFKMFDLVSEGSGNITVNISHLDMKYTFGLEKSVVSGSIGSVGTYTRTLSGSGANTVCTMRYQGDTNEYKQLVVTGFEQTYTVSGHKFTAYLDSTEGYCRLVIPLDIMNSLPYKKFVELYENSLCMLAYSMEVVEVKWYETAAFGTLLKIVAIVLTVVMLISGFSDGGFLIELTTELAVTAALAIGTTVTLSAYIAVYIALAIVVSALGTVLISSISEQIGGELGAIAAAALSLYIASYATNGSTTNFTAQQWLRAANEGLSTYAQWIGHKAEEFTTMAEEFMKDIGQKIKELEEKTAEYENDVGRMFVDQIGTANPAFNTIEQYCSSITRTSVATLVDYGAQIDYAIRVRSDVSGSLLS